MAEQKLLDILKNALLLEHRGKALYESVLQASTSPAVRQLFGELAGEEASHIAMLETQYKAVSAGHVAAPIDLPARVERASDAILTKKLIAEISAAGYEAAVISAAIELENNAIAYYAEQAEMADENSARALFSWLSGWEKSHLALLAGMDHELREKIWSDNQFWPLD